MSSGRIKRIRFGKILRLPVPVGNYANPIEKKYVVESELDALSNLPPASVFGSLVRKLKQKCELSDSLDRHYTLMSRLIGHQKKKVID